MATMQQIIDTLPERSRDSALELYNNMVFMRQKLEETRGELASQPVAIPYDNGGGQTGIRENPAYKAYHALLASYRKTTEQLLMILRDANESETSENPLAQILAEAETMLNA